MMKLPPGLRILNGRLSDSIFTLMTVEPNITWNVSAIERAIRLGAFGPPVTWPMSAIAANPPRYDLGGLDRAKVALFKTMPALIETPLISIESERGGILCICDGQHRLTARYELGKADWRTHIVPVKAEREFRLDL